MGDHRPAEGWTEHFMLGVSIFLFVAAIALLAFGFLR